MITFPKCCMSLRLISPTIAFMNRIALFIVIIVQRGVSVPPLLLLGHHSVDVWRTEDMDKWIGI